MVSDSVALCQISRQPRAGGAVRRPGPCLALLYRFKMDPRLRGDDGRVRGDDGRVRGDDGKACRDDGKAWLGDG